jgi:hypothetical protein
MSTSTRFGRILFAAAVVAVTVFTVAPPAVAACTTPAWNPVPSPNVSSDEDSVLAALDIIAASNIWAVGSSTSGDARNTLIEHWNGRKWTIVPSPNGAQPVNWLTGVSAVSASDIWAVGYTNDGGGATGQSFNLILHYDGTSWTEVAAPNPIPDPNPGDYPVTNELYAVHAISANNVWAVGHLYTYSLEHAVTLHWNGTQWSDASRQLPSRYTRLRSIDAVAANDIWAVGEIQRLGTQQTLTEHFDGTSWSVVPSPNASPNADYLMSVSMVSSNNVWAVGYGNQVIDFSQHYQTQSWHFDGTSWSLVDAPDINTQNNYLRAVVGVAPDRVFAVGFWDTGAKLRSLAERYNGTSWGFQTSGNRSDVLDEPVAVDAGPGGAPWAVGQWFGAFNYRTLVLRFGC